MKGISEKTFEGQVKHLAKMFGWRYYHTWRSIHSPAGFPDCVMVRPPRLIFAELKSEEGTTSPEQEAWLDDLRECIKMISLGPIERKGKPIADGWAGIERLVPSFECYLWRPSAFDKIAEVLK